MPQGSIAPTWHPLRVGSFILKHLLSIYFVPGTMLGGSRDTKMRKMQSCPQGTHSSLTRKQIFAVQCDNPVYIGAV